MFNGLKLLLLLLTFTTVSFAQNGKLFNTENGLSSSLASQVMQRHDGRIVIATHNGLNIYDGYTFRIIKQGSVQGKGLESSYFNSMCEDKRGNLFVATNTGIFRFNGHRFIHYNICDEGHRPVRTYINHLSVCHDGTILASTSGFGIQVISPQGNDTVCKKMTGGLAKYQRVSKTLEDHQRRLWVIDDKNILHCLQPNGRVLNSLPMLEDIKVNCLCEDSQGNLYVGSQNQGVYIIHRGSYVAERIAVLGSPDNVSCITVTRKGFLLVGCNGTGIIAYNIRTGMVMPNPFFSNLTNLAHGKVESIIEDRQGNIWIAMLQKGVYMQPFLSYEFHYQGPRLGTRNAIGDYCVNSVLLSRNGNLWVGTDMGGIYELDLNGSLLHHYYEGVPKVIMALSEDKEDRIWVGSFNEGCGFIEDGKYHPVDLLHADRLDVFDIKIDDDGIVWIATMGRGLIRYDTKGNVSVFHANSNAYNNQKVNSIPNNYLTSIEFSKDGKRIFVGTSVGLSCYDKVKKSWTSFFGSNCIHKDVMITNLFEDSKGRLWFAGSNGMWVYNFNKKKETLISVKDGMPSNDVSFITEDCIGRMWVGTTNGLACLDQNKIKIENYFADNGLQSNEFSMRAVSRNSKGSLILMGGTGGINWFNPLVVHQSKWNANVMITGVSSNDYDVLDNDKLVFAHDNNSFTLFLSTNTYNDVEQITYAYKLDNDKWEALPQGTNNLLLSRMPSGTHHLLVKALRNGQETPVKEYTIKVKAAWYATTWAKLVYLLIFCFVVWLCRQDYRHKQHIRNLLVQMKEIKKFVIPINKDLDTQTPDDKLMERVMKYINENLSDSDLSVEKIADAVGISRVHLHRKMKELTGQTPHALLKHLRLRQAAKLLEDPKQSISDVVYSCGFANTASFSTMFKAEYGVTPREYKKGERKVED